MKKTILWTSGILAALCIAVAAIWGGEIASSEKNLPMQISPTSCGKRFKGHPVLEDKILAVALEANKGSPSYLPQIFGYALEHFGKDKNRLERLFSYAASFGNGERGTVNGKRGFDWRQLFAMGDFRTDRTAFRMLANFRNESEPPAGTAKVPETDYDAPLVSDDALVLVSSSGKGDTPEDYARVSDATPYDPKRNGLFATKAEDAPWAIVELAGAVKVSGVTVMGEAKGLSFWLSDDGEEWRKVEPGGGKKSLSLKKILVYGSKLY